MGYEKISITIPDDIYRQIKQLSERRDIKLSQKQRRSVSCVYQQSL